MLDPGSFATVLATLITAIGTYLGIREANKRRKGRPGLSVALGGDEQQQLDDQVVIAAAAAGKAAQADAWQTVASMARQFAVLQGTVDTQAATLREANTQIEAQRVALDTAARQAGEDRERIGALELYKSEAARQLAIERARVAQLVHWGRYATDPVPREPPPYPRQDDDQEDD